MNVVNLFRFYKLYASSICFIGRKAIERSGKCIARGELKLINCVDIGSGIAPYEKHIKKCFKTDAYIPIDIAPSDKTKIVGDACRLPFANDSIGCVVSFDVIQHIPRPDLMLSEVERVLVPKGYLLLTYPFLYAECDAHDFQRWTVEGMEKLLIEHGFEINYSRRRGGALFAGACLLNWMVQHALPGQRASWRTERNIYSAIRTLVTLVLTLPTQMLCWVALLLDKAIKTKGFYMGGEILATKTDAGAFR